MARFYMETDRLGEKGGEVRQARIVSTTGRLSSDYSSASIEVQDEILTRQANLCADLQRKNAGSMLNEKGFGTGGTQRAIRVTSPFSRGNVRSIKIAFFGTRKDGTRNAEVAFFNEFGIGDGNGQKMSKRNFIAKANEAKADECAEIAADIFAAYVADQIQI